MEHLTTFDSRTTDRRDPLCRANDAETVVGLVMALVLSVGTALLVLNFL